VSDIVPSTRRKSPCTSTVIGTGSGKGLNDKTFLPTNNFEMIRHTEKEHTEDAVCDNVQIMEDFISRQRKKRSLLN
jgi:hypothetical protein